MPPRAGIGAPLPGIGRGPPPLPPPAAGDIRAAGAGPPLMLEGGDGESFRMQGAFRVDWKMIT